jgi:aconitate hydratase
MAPEYGATCGFFPIDGDHQLPQDTGRDRRVALVEAYAKAQGMWRDEYRPIRSSPTRWNSTSRRRAVAGRPEAPAGPRALRRSRPGFANMETRNSKKRG